MKRSILLKLWVIIILIIVVYEWVEFDNVDNKSSVSSYPAQNSDFSELVFWSSDFHISPVADIKFILGSYGVKSIIDKSLSGHCQLTKTCQQDLHVLTKENGIELSPCPNKLRKLFFDVYEYDSEFSTVDAILCTHACSMCEVFMPFNKSLIVIASTRFEIGRHSATRWTEWITNLRRIGARSQNVIAANNRYDQEYLKYFTGIKNVVLLPNLCGYVNTRYNPSRPQILIAPARDRLKTIRFGNPSDTKTVAITFSPIRSLYAHFTYADLASHPAIVILPYQVSFMSFFEFYRMCIPLFVPSPELLTEWHMTHRVLNERTWPTVFGRPSNRSAVLRHPESTSLLTSDPNNEFDGRAVLEWVRLADFYQWPHIVQFNSFEDLLQSLVKVDLNEISKNMQKYNTVAEREIKSKWNDILMKVKRYSSKYAGSSASSVVKSESVSRRSIDDALQAIYEIRLKPECSGTDDL